MSVIAVKRRVQVTVSDGRGNPMAHGQRRGELKRLKFNYRLAGACVQVVRARRTFTLPPGRRGPGPVFTDN